ncbi:gliding motility-associated-like protein [Chitinophaga dinghuensis]|uniref:Gliding motility-associated-like protein n=1 Tax=Chitinophaga dinghuensis TaxID=1539050 RepID=A0A327VQ79_9BACT|nr:Ig-like domain-containing protein [Chitinophaga dinghuensis]RAJ76584.1 gliding motility-associated-like protein [Chitinophaga dinghuensis]
MKYIFSILLSTIVMCLGNWHSAVAANNRIATNVASAFQIPTDPFVVGAISTSPNPSNASSVTYVVTFSSNVVSVTTSAFGVVTTGDIQGAAVSSVSGFGNRFTVTVWTGTGSGTLALTVNGNGIRPAVTNVPYTVSSDFTYIIDKTAPTLSVGMIPGTPYINPPMNMVTLITNVTDNIDQPWDLKVSCSNDSITWLTSSAVSPTHPLYALTPGNGLKKIYVTAQDRAGNTTSATYTVTVDATPVTVRFTSTPPLISNQSSVTLRYSANKPIINTYHINFDGSTFDEPTGEMTILSLPEGPHTFTLYAEDLAGNVSGQISTSWVTDLTPPTVLSVGFPAPAKYLPGQPLIFDVKMSEPVKFANGNIPYIDVTIGGNTRRANYVSGANTDTWTFAYVVQDDDYEPVGIQLANTITMNGNVLTDLANNPLPPALNNISTNMVLVGNKPITGSIQPPVNLSATTIRMMVTFEEAVTGLDLSKIQLQGVPGAYVLQTIPSPITPTTTYTFDVILPGSINTTLNVTIPFKSVTAVSSGGFNQVVTSSVQINNIPPMVVNVSGPLPGYYKAGQVLNYVVYLNKSVNVASNANPLYLELKIGTATVRANYVSGTGSNALLFSYTVQLGDNDNTGIGMTNQLFDPNYRITDDYYSQLLGLIPVPGPTGVKVNTTTPTLTFNASGPVVKTGDFTLSIDFSEPVQGLNPGSFLLSNARLQNLVSADNQHFTATVTPIADGPMGITLPANKVVNIGGNGNAVQTVNLVADITPPTITTITGPADGYYITGDKLRFVVGFSEAMNIDPGTATPFVTVTLGSKQVQAVYESSDNSSMTFSYTIQDGDEAMSGIGLTGSINPGGAARIQDVAGNNAILTLNGIPDFSNVKVHTAYPTVIISTTSSAMINGPVSVAITFSEAVTGLTLTDFQVQNSTLDNLHNTDNISYTATITPSVDGPVSLSLPANKVVSISNTGNRASNTLSFTADMTPPSILSVVGPANKYYKEGDVLTFKVDFSEPIVINRGSGNPYMAVNMQSGVVPAYLTSYSGNTAYFAYTVQPGDESISGISIGAGISLGGTDGSIKDLAGNDARLYILNLPDFSGVKVHTAHAAVFLNTAAVSPVNGVFLVNITFSEAVSGFIPADIQVTGGSVASVATSDNIHYYAAIRPTVDGTVTVAVPANVAMNVANNGNQASNTVSVVADLTAPTITGLTVPAAGWYNIGDQLDFILTYDEPVVLTGGNTYIPLQIGADVAKATYVSGSGTNQLTFRYTVQAGDQALNGIAYTPTLQTGTDNYSDIAGNAAPKNIPVIATSNVQVNTIVATITTGRVPVDGIYNTGKKLTFTIAWTGGLTVTGTPLLPVTIGRSTVYAKYTGKNGANALIFVYTIVDGDNDMDGIELGNAILLNGGTITCGGPVNADLTLHNISSTAGILVNTTYPTVILSGNIPARTNTAFTVNATFSEAVTGLTIANIIVNNGTISGLQTTDNIHFTFTLTPAADGTVTVTIPANAAQNIGSNGNKVSNTVQVTADMTAPIINAGQQFSVDEYSAVGTVVGQVIATDASYILQNWSLTDPSGIFSIDAATGIITVKDATKLNTKINTTVPVTVTVTDGLNTSVPATVNITVVYVPLAPTDMSISNTNISENTAVGTVIGQLSTITSEPGATFTYTLVAGAGATDNSSFNLAGNQLQNSQVFKYAAQKTYSVRIRTTQSNGLYFEKIFTIQVLQVNQAPVLDPIQNQVICSTTDKQKVQLTGGSAVEADQTLSYAVRVDQAFFNTLTVDNSGLISYSLKPNVAGTVQVTVVLKDNGGTANQGVDTLIRSFTLTVHSLPQVSITADKTGAISKGDIVILTATGGTNYVWSNADGILSGQQSATLQVRPAQSATYQVTASNAEGCSSVQQINITVVTDFKVEATNLLTPNGDGINDKWVIRNLDSYPQNDLTIFDRSGRMVYHQQNYSNQWDGKLNGQPLSEGTYYYILKISGTDKVAKGFITILRN